MSKKLKFVWIDDEDRSKDAQNLEKQLRIKCVFLNVEPKNVNYLSAINETKPDLILIDHNLTDIGTGDIKKGSTIAALIREKHPRLAVACITGQQSDGMDSQQRLSYEAVFSLDEIKDHYQSMKSIASSFRKLNIGRPKTPDGLLKLLKAPEADIIKLKNILPKEIKENFSDHALFSNISHWIRKVLMERPGFLYDRLWASTLLGLNETGFKKVEKLFSAAKYKGLFCDESKERWWKSELLQILSKHVKSSSLPWEKGRNLPEVNSKNYSKDYYTDYKEDFPETVAFVDETSDNRAQMKLKYTVPHPRYDKLLFFEEIRMMKAD